MDWIPLVDAALTSALILLLPTLWLALRLPRMGDRGRALILALCALPLLLPASLLPLEPMVTQALTQLPALLLPLYLGLRHFTPSLGEAAAGLGMGLGGRLRHLHLPRLAPPILIALPLATLVGLVHEAPLGASIMPLAPPVLLLLYALARLAEARR